MPNRTEKEIVAELNFVLNQYEKEYGKLNAKVYSRTLELMSAGVVANKAMTVAFREFGYNAAVTTLITESSSRIIATRGAINEPIITNYWLEKLWPGDKFKLSETVSKNTNIVRSTITEQLRLDRSWTNTAIKIRDTQQIEANLPRYLKDLVSKAREANKHAFNINGNKATNKAYKKAVIEYKRAAKKALNNINRLAQNDAPTEALKKAYANLVKQTEKFSEKAIDKAVQRSIKNRAKYLSQRIARTEFVRANSVSKYLEYIEDDIEAYKISLNPRHKIKDICDFHTSVNLYGWGAGVYPIRVPIQVPFHSHCFCLISRVFNVQNNARFSKQRGADWVVANPGLVRKMTNKQTFAQLQKDPTKWNKLLRGYNPPRKIPLPPKGSVLINPTQKELEQFNDRLARQA